ncbi:hypothetical protein KR093_005355, partial [Drosophila rubida]
MLQLLLLLPGQVLNNSLILENESLETEYLKNVIENAVKERSANTLILRKRQANFECPLKDFNLEGMPVLRLNETTTVPIKLVYNCEVIAVVCMTELADSNLLTVLAQDLDRMRETRIIIWLQSAPTNVMDCLNVIRDYARNYNFVNVMVLHSSSLLQKSIVAYRLQPFPDPKMVRISDILSTPMFPDFWRNFRNKTAMIVPNLFPPSSYKIQDRKSGMLKLSGHMDMLLLEFASKHNINLKLPRQLNELESIRAENLLELISTNKVDLTMGFQRWNSMRGCTTYVVMSRQFIIVPCGKAIGIGDVYKSLTGFLIILLAVYLSVSVATTLLEAISCRILGRRYRFSYGNLFVNLNVFGWVLGLPRDLQRHRRSRSLHQVIMVMSFFSLIVVCFFNANLSTFLTKRPRVDEIKTFEDLKASGLKVTYEDTYFGIALKNMEPRISETQIVYVPNSERIRMILALNTSNAYHTFDMLWEVVRKYQKYYRDVVLCTSAGLQIIDTMPYHVMLPPNSIYLQALDDYILRVHDVGIHRHWLIASVNNLIAYSTRSQEYPQPTPLSCDDLKWVWYLLGVCYTGSIFVFIGELCVNR